MKYTSLFFAILLSVSFKSDHKYYIALTEIEYVEKKKNVQMIMNVFLDDFETSLNEEYNIDLQLTTANELTNADHYFVKYLEKNFKIWINETTVNYTFIGKEYEGDIVYFYLEIENVETVNSLTVKNTMLIKQFPEQQNLIKAVVNAKRKSLFLDRSTDKGLLKF
ncbi:DUF6702 family protein [Tenacibaculum sp. SG-28]|uniref:DUF6702 family protein n=1 Tax=Tenacibaculum sp. SG-28 TaxID=754426 RepID=UPI000CF4DA35|nr:DUF6702 family protein [Tenacibaculum sp. SG-28]PQJ23242.1 hypothetical protein BSU00_03210 [Tenacibaculum sp. SG-28]